MARRKRSSFEFKLDPETKRSVAVVFLCAFSLLLFFGMFDLGGSLGVRLDGGLTWVFGWDRFFLPFISLAIAYHLAAPDRFQLHVKNIIGICLLFLSLNPFMHVIAIPEVGSVPDQVVRAVGGKLGHLLSAPLVAVLGLWGVRILFGALFVISVLLIFNLTIEHIRSLFDWIKKLALVLVHGVSWPMKQLIQWREQSPKAFSTAPTSTNELLQSYQSNAGEEEAVEDLETVSTEETDEEDGADEPDEEEESSEEEGAGDESVKRNVPAPKPKKHYPKIEIPLDLLDRRDQKPTSGDITHNREVVRRTLDKFGIPVDMGEVSVGPTVTQFTLKPSDGVKLSRITALHNDLALALAAHPIRIEAPIPGKSLVGIEVPNQSVATVGLREILESKEFRERKVGALNFVLGKDVAGKPWTADLGRMPHLLVAGATGSGKSVCLNVIIMTLLYTFGPDELKFLMVDPKRVELQVYNGLPHLVTPVITKTNETVNALKWGLREMDHRYDLLSKVGARDLASYNSRVEDKIPYLVIIVDELADLMATSSSEIEGPIVRLAQMARAVGIHLVLATQRPSVDVITGLIKANVPARIAFAVASSTDSRTILDQQGADKLIGRGDMLLSTAELATPKRIQGAFVSDGEISRVVDFIKSKCDPADYDFSVTQRNGGGPGGAGSIGGGAGGDGEDDDPLLPDAKEEIIRAGKASASLLQRRLKVGYARAARLLDLLEQGGFIGPADGAKPREILKADFGRQLELDSEPSEAEVNQE
ncbi:DNA translocase FtsK 4TM domain-containing protein [Patescibacteria group bacterium]|nr:DNA translocase FtsK 4TM domain-containing protein [Patescibacteria group bacterium]